MEIMYSIQSYDIFDKNVITGVYGDKIDLIKRGIDFRGIEYDDDWTVKKFFDCDKNNEQKTVELFNEFEINLSLLNKKIKDLSNGHFKLVLLCYVILNKKNILFLDYFDKGLSFKYKKRVINYLKCKYEGTLVVISNDLTFLDMLCSKLIVFKNDIIVFNDKLEYIYKSNVKIEYPEIIKFIRLANENKAKLSYTVHTHELVKDIYRSVR